MDESSMYRALIIGVALFIAIATITGVLSYYNTAKAMVQAIGNGTDYDAIYTDYIENVLLCSDTGSTITGEEAVNLINYFYKDEDTTINVTKVIPLYTDTPLPEGQELINQTLRFDNINNNEDVYNNNISKIVPSQNFKITKTKDAGKLTIDLEGKK